MVLEEGYVGPCAIGIEEDLGVGGDVARGGRDLCGEA
jgi:hypothetical protein